LQCCWKFFQQHALNLFDYHRKLVSLILKCVLGSDNMFRTSLNHYMTCS